MNCILLNRLSTLAIAWLEGILERTDMSINVFSIIKHLPFDDEKKETLEFESAGNLKMYLMIYGIIKGHVIPDGHDIPIEDICEPYKKKILDDMKEVGSREC